MRNQTKKTAPFLAGTLATVFLGLAGTASAQSKDFILDEVIGSLKWQSLGVG